MLGHYSILEDWGFRCFLLLLLERQILGKAPLFSVAVAGGDTADVAWHKKELYDMSTSEITANIKQLVKDATRDHPETFPYLDAAGGVPLHGMRRQG
jgi:hypothetical protein